MPLDVLSPHKVEIMVAGQPFTELQSDLFIPPDALQVLLDSFSGPLDLLLYLIRQHNIDIMDIPMTLITRQYLEYIDLLESHRMELAAEYLVMAAWLLEIKSKCLLPARELVDPKAEEDPRMTLVMRLQAYEKFKLAASALESLPRLERDCFQVYLPIDTSLIQKAVPEVEMVSLVDALRRLMQREKHEMHHQIRREMLSVRERMSLVLHALQQTKVIEFTELLTADEGRMGLVVSLLAILELARQSLVVITQSTIYSHIYLQAKPDG